MCRRSDGEPLSQRLPDHAFIFSVELQAIQLATDRIIDEKYFRYIIFTDSLSAMQALQNPTSNNPLVLHIIFSFLIIELKRM